MKAKNIIYCFFIMCISGTALAMEHESKERLMYFINHAIVHQNIEDFKKYLNQGAWRLYDVKGNTILHSLAKEQFPLDWYKAFYETCGRECTALVLNKKNNEDKTVLDLLAPSPSDEVLDAYNQEPSKKIDWSSLRAINLDDYEKSLLADSEDDDIQENSADNDIANKKEIAAWIHTILDA